MPAYYNEIEPYAAQWLRNLIAANHIAPGDVDERSIEDVRPDDIRGYTQCHFFAGIGVWSRALRFAGWPDDRPVWTGSCPCQPFSTAGKGAGFADERHLWPAWFHLIGECKPATIFGEQVASKDADPWVDLVHTDMETLDYAFGAIPFPSASVGAPHIRDRDYWMAHSYCHGRKSRQQRLATLGYGTPIESDSRAGRMAYADSRRRERSEGEIQTRWLATNCGLPSSGLAYANGGDAGAERQQRGGEQRQQQAHGGVGRRVDASPNNGFWRDADWLFCRDRKWRPVEPGTFPLAHGAPSRVGRLRAYGNAINAIQAQIFIEIAMESIDSLAKNPATTKEET